MIVGNPTARAKAVRIAGGHVIIEPGKTETVKSDLTEAEVDRYKAAGLKFKSTNEEAKAEADAKAKADKAEADAKAQPAMPTGKK